MNHPRRNRSRGQSPPDSEPNSKSASSEPAGDGSSDSESRERIQNSTQLAPGSIELEFGIPIAGVILSPEQWAKTALKRLPDQQKIDFSELFGRDAPRVLDIGCGNGRFLIASAVRRPEMDHMGIDALPLVVRYATRRANMRGLHNCRLAVCDGERFLRNYCAAGQWQEIHIYHPQPYHEPGKRQLRLFSHDFLWLLHQSLTADGRLIVQTDNAAYWEYLKQVLPTITHWQEQLEPWPEDPQGRSRREIIATRKGLVIYRGWGERRADVTAESFTAAVAELPQPNFDSSHRRNPKRWRRR